MSFQQATTGRLRLHVLPTNRFKTYAISLFAGVPLREDTVTSTALTPFVLRRGTQSAPETIAFREQLDEMYGAGFGFDVYKRGSSQIVQFRMDVINDRFVSAGSSLLARSMRFLGEAVTAPALENGAFRAKYVESEKNTLTRKLESIINDKIRYAGERCLEIMCEGDPYRLPSLGRIQDLSGLTPQTLHEAYAAWLSEAVLDLYVVGDTTLEEVKRLAEASFQLPQSPPTDYGAPDIRRRSGEVKTVVEKLDVAQGKLNLGLRTGIAYGDDEYAAALLYNGILGGFPHSKLFMNVREKESLAYYASSRMDGHKGLLTIQSGIEIANYEKAVAIIKEQLESMRQGQLSELELSQTKAMLVNSLRELQDSAYEMIAFDFNSVLSGRRRTAQELLDAVQAVAPEQIMRVAAGVELDTVYFLRDRKEG
ncbi:insulinase family protein [Paenibacillus albicereus]|uniref:Insulinase family protein n=1 Tax=Paenibacillus albicereus TaxID=2726185 RepID=A0A6H2GXV4_9BACL|nr:pitrilysin family protein [Paenibacillus albicereus]QJC52227.1 insulinase family protein [Paenibacillus albicereus]